MDTRTQKRLLFYNWAPFDSPGLAGGGVTVYLRNLLEELSRRDGLELYFLSLGTRQNWTDRGIRTRETQNALSHRGVRSFELINSPVRVAGRRMAYFIETWRQDHETPEAIARFVQENGPFDAVHIHNLEGVSSPVLGLKQRFPETGFYFTWHNYVPVCPQVHLLYRDVEPCLDYADGARCVDCVGRAPFDPRRSRPWYAGLAEAFARLARGDEVGAGCYKAWRETNVELLNSHMDGSIAVSDVVKSVVTGLGVASGKVAVLPPGMDVHREPAAMRAAARAKPERERIVFSYVGASAAYKGLPFLVDALERAASALLRERAEMLVAADLSTDGSGLKRRLEKLFHRVRFIDGYERDRLETIAQDIDVNIVPSIWPEAFHQVGYELLCFGTPSILADRVGLAMFYDGHPDFIFETNNAADLVDRMTALVDAPERLAAFWDTPIRLPGMGDHADALLQILLGGR